MKVTKFVHSCLLVEMSEPINRNVLFDPGVMSGDVLDVDTLPHLDDIIITHKHGDHMSPELIKRLVAKFPDVRITTTPEAVAELKEQGITASAEASDGIVFFKSPHESVEPLFPAPEEIGVHWLDILSNPGDSHSFHETKSILALPVTAPWGSTIKAINLALELRPKYVLPIHDWHWRDEAREQMYETMSQVLADKGIAFVKLATAQPVTLDV